MTIPGSAKDGVGKFERDNGERTSGEQRDPAAKSEKKKIYNRSKTMTKTKSETIKEQACNVNG